MVNTLADIASAAPDVLRFGKGIGCAIFNDQASGYDRAWAVANDALRGLTLTGIGSGARAAAKGIGKATFRAAKSLSRGAAKTSTKVFKSFTKSSYKYNLQVLTGKSGVGMDARHIFKR